MGDTYTIYASGAGKQPGDKVRVLAAGTPIDLFTESLNKDKCMVLANAPSDTTAFDASDQTAQWFAKLDKGATVSLTVDETAAKEIVSFAVSLEVTWKLSFSSASDILLFTFGPGGVPSGAVPPGGVPSGARIPSPGLTEDGKVLVCGLDFANTGNITGVTLKDVFEFAALKKMVKFLPPDFPVISVDLRAEDSTTSKRNAIWFTPGAQMLTSMRLQFRLSALDALQETLGSALKGFTITSADVIGKRSAVLAQTEDGPQPVPSGEVNLSVGCTVKAETPGAVPVDMLAGVQFLSYGMTLSLVFLTPNPLTGILQWLGWLIGDPSFQDFIEDTLNKKEGEDSILPEFTLRSMRLSLDTTKDAKKPKLTDFVITVEVLAGFGREGADEAAAFLLSYRWNYLSAGYGSLAGRLWNDYDLNKDLDLRYRQEKWTDLKPALTPQPATSISLASIIPSKTIQNIPDTLPSQITRAQLALSQDEFSFGGALEAKRPEPGTLPQPFLGTVFLDASFSWGKSSAFKLDAGFTAGLIPSKTSKVQETAKLNGSLSYDSAAKTWLLKAALEGLHASSLAEFFEEDTRTHVMPLIDAISISELAVEYKYTGAAEGKSKASEFSIKGTLYVSELELDLDFHRVDKTWEFSARLNPKARETTIGDVIAAILGDDGDLELPDFLSDMEFVGEDQDAFNLSVDKKEAKQDDVVVESFQFLSQIRVGKLSIVFAQLHSSDWGPTAQSKRLVKVGVDSLPGLSVDVPMVGKLEQPIDELYFMWVQDPSPLADMDKEPSSSAKTREAGLTRGDIDQLNETLADKLVFNVKTEVEKVSDLFVTAGSHFVIMIKDSSEQEKKCLLDYAFMKPKDQEKKSRLAVASAAAEPSEPAAAELEDGPTAQAPFKKKAGPVSISNVGLKYNEKKLSLMFDAECNLGPLEFSLLGFSINAKITTLDQVPELSASIEGFAVAYENQPLTIAGTIRHGNDGALDYYAGGLIIGYTPYQFQAAGFYGVVTPEDVTKPKFTSIFIFAKLDGPLVTIAVADISSICGGFGYKSNVRLPTIEQVPEFPLIANEDLGSGKSALQVLTKLTDPGPSGWFQPLDNNYWFAAGMKVSAFQMLSIDAVAVMQFGESVRIAVFANALGDVPSAQSTIKFAHVELGIALVVDVDHGTFRAEAQLSPRSFVLHPDCHLTGGAALCYWFDGPKADKLRAGDYVFTIGGYHGAYSVPDGYPVPPRLGISWSVSPDLSISGEAYFAITPKVCMGGGRLHASYSAGPIEAWFDAFADFLINYKPFRFSAQAGVSVGVRFNIDMLFIHTHIEAEISAQLYLWGPPLAGRVHVDLWICAFDIPFGDGPLRPEAVSLYDFYLLVLQTQQQQQRNMERSLAASDDPQPPRPKNEGHVFAARSGLVNVAGDRPQRDPGEPWTVRGGTFAMAIECKMAVTGVRLTDDGPDIIKGSDPYAKPMQLFKPMTSTLVVKFTQDGVAVEEEWRIESLEKPAPRALWDRYNGAEDPISSGNNISELLNGANGNMSLLMGVEICAPKSKMPKDPFPAFDTADASKQVIPAARPFPRSNIDADPTWAPASPLELQDQYKAVHGTWVAPGWGTTETGQRGFVEGWAAVFSWDETLLGDAAGLPTRMNLRFDDLYVAPPCVSVEA